MRAYPTNTDEAESYGASAAPDVQRIDTGDPGNPQEVSVRSIVLGFLLDEIDHGDGHNYYWHVDVTIIWKPSQALLKSVQTAYTTAQAKFTAATERAHKDALFKAARDRVKAASVVRARPFDELREEERIIVYRLLIRKLLEVSGITVAGQTDEDDKLRHVFSEVVESMFDVDKLLYFVAPEWWRPHRAAVSLQAIGLQAKPPRTPAPGALALGKVRPANPVVDSDFDFANTTDWGGGSRRPSNYYITEGSAPARLGSSLGWLLQLDGDNSRNAFLNAP